VLCAGGSQDRLGTATAHAEIRDGEGPPRRIADLARPRRHHTITRLRDGRLLVVGGEGPGGALRNTAEIFD
jgi:hypothetical protein